MKAKRNQVKLEDILVFSSGKTKPKDTSEESASFPVYGGNGVLGYSKEYLLDGDHILIGRVGEYCGVTRLVSGQKWVTDNCLYSKSIDRSVDPYYLSEQLSYLDLNRYRKKGGQPLITQAILNNISITLPPLEEQKKIAQILSTWDEAIEVVDGLIEKKKKLFKSLSKKLFFHTNEWSKKKISNFCNCYSGGTPSRKNPHFYEGDIPWIKSGELNNIYIHETEEKITSEALANSSAKIVEKNNILLALYGATAGVIGFTKIDASINQAILAIIPDEKIVTKKYLLYYLRYVSPRIVHNNVQGGQPNLSGSIIKSLDIFYPDIENQNKIANALEILEKEISLLERKANLFKKQKKGLMQRLLTGKVRVN